MRRCMYYHPNGESWELKEGNQKGNQYTEESWFPRQGSYQQRENWFVNGGIPWNYSRAGGKRIGFEFGVRSSEFGIRRTCMDRTVQMSHLPQEMNFAGEKEGLLIQENDEIRMVNIRNRKKEESEKE